MVAQARASGAPRLDRAQAAQLLGADPLQLDDALAGHADDAHAPRTQSGLREDQAAAAWSALTDGQLVSVINAPAGSGKTRVLAEAARIWAEAGLGPVIGITPSQSARNTLAAGVPVSYNSAQFLGHLPGRRGARGPVRIGPGTLLVIDEASMLSGPDLADLIAYARARGAKVILAGDVSQLQAVENGGGLSLLAAALGYVRLAEPVRFRHRWEQHASLRLRDGDTTVLADYDQHGRIIGGEPGADDGRRRGRLRRAVRRRHRHLADGRRPRAAPGTVPPDPRRAHPAGHRQGRPRGPDRRRRPGQSRGPDHLHPQRPHGRGGRARPDSGQRRPAPHRGRHPERPDRAPCPGRRPAHRAAAVDRPHFRARKLRRLRARLCGHRSCRPGPDRAHRAGGDHRDRGPPARLRGPVPRHRRQPRLRVHRVPQARRPGARPAPGSRAGPLRPPRRRTRQPARRGQHGGGAGRAGRRAGPGRPAALGHPDPPPGPGRRRPPGHAARDLGRRDHPGPPAAVPGPADEHRAA